MFNSLITGFAPSCYALWEQDINPKDNANIRNSMPKIYDIFKHKELFSYGNFIFWFSKGLIQSFIIYFITFYCINASAVRPDGFVDDLWTMSITSYSSTFAVIMLELTIETMNFTVIVHLFYWVLSVLIYFPIFVFVYDKFDSSVQYYAKDMFINSTFWFVVFLNMAIFGVWKYILYVLKRFYRPDEVHKLQYERFFNGKEKKEQKNKENKQNSASSQKRNKKQSQKDVEREHEMENLAKESEGGDNVAYETAGMEKKNIMNYNFTNHLKNGE